LGDRHKYLPKNETLVLKKCCIHIWLWQVL
jgi:hypothetical protein